MPIKKGTTQPRKPAPPRPKVLPAQSSEDLTNNDPEGANAIDDIRQAASGRQRLSIQHISSQAVQFIPHPITGLPLFAMDNDRIVLNPINPPLEDPSITEALIIEARQDPSAMREKMIAQIFPKLIKLLGLQEAIKKAIELDLNISPEQLEATPDHSSTSSDPSHLKDLLLAIFEATHHNEIETIKATMADKHPREGTPYEVAIFDKYGELKRTSCQFPGKSIREITEIVQAYHDDVSFRKTLKISSADLFSHPAIAPFIPDTNEKAIETLQALGIPYTPTGQSLQTPSAERVLLDHLQYGRMAIAEGFNVEASKEEILAALESHATIIQQTLNFLNENDIGGHLLLSALHRHLQEIKDRKQVLEQEAPYLLTKRPYAEHNFPSMPNREDPKMHIAFWTEADPRHPITDKESDYIYSISAQLMLVNKLLAAIHSVKTLTELKTQCFAIVSGLAQTEIRGIKLDATCHAWIHEFGLGTPQIRRDLGERTTTDTLYNKTELLHMDQDTILYQIFKKAHKLAGKPNRDPMNQDDRAKTLSDLEEMDPENKRFIRILRKFAPTPTSKEIGIPIEETIEAASRWHKQTFHTDPPFPATDSSLFLLGGPLLSEQLHACLPGADLHHFSGIGWAEFSEEPLESTTTTAKELLAIIKDKLITLREDRSTSPQERKIMNTVNLHILLQTLKAVGTKTELTSLPWPQTLRENYESIGPQAGPGSIEEEIKALPLDQPLTIRLNERIIYFHILENIAHIYKPEIGPLDLMNPTHRALLLKHIQDNKAPETEIDEDIISSLLTQADILFKNEETPPSLEGTNHIKKSASLLKEWTEHSGIPETESYLHALEGHLRGEKQIAIPILTSEETSEDIYQDNPQLTQTNAGIWGISSGEHYYDLVIEIMRLNRTLGGATPENPEPESTAETLENIIRLFHELRKLRSTCKLKGINWKSTHPATPPTETSTLHPRSSIHLCESILITRIICLINGALGDYSRDALTKSDRDETLEELKVLASEEIKSIATTFNETPQNILAMFTEIFERADHIFPSPFQDFEHFGDFAKANFKSNSGKKKSQSRSRRRRGGRLEQHHNVAQIEADIDASIEACLKWAIYVPHDLKGFVGNLEEIRTCDKIKSCYIEHENPEGILYPPNLKCHGHFDIKFGKITHRLKWHLTPDAKLTIHLNGSEYNESDFDTEPLKALYLELKRIILKGLEGRLVRDFNEQESERVRHITGGKIAKALQVQGRKGSPVTIRPRIDQLFRGGEGKRKQRTENDPSMPFMKTRIHTALRRIGNQTPLNEAFLEPITLYLKETKKAPNGQEVDLYIPVNTLETLIALHNGELKEEDIFLNTLTRGFAKAGYRVQSKIEPDGTSVHHCKPAKQSFEAQQRYDLMKTHLGIKLSAEGLKDRTQITIPNDVDAVVIAAPEATPDATSTRITLDEIVDFLEAAERGEEPKHATIEAIEAKVPDPEIIAELSEGPGAIDQLREYTRSRIHRVAFHAPQTPQFRQGTFVPLKTILQEEPTETN